MIEIEDHALLADDPGGPVVLLNRLRFRPDDGRAPGYQAITPRCTEAPGEPVLPPTTPVVV
ncbi:hypothetical protein [Amycolatopsis sp. lyj-346]|uniref:hypothetical protein n=1 Tax=Amycolatopsis sp. lyj-346 TaxID=2789289 RepID=UPI00397D5DF2